MAFTDAPAFATDDPQATLLTQVQGVIAEYEKAKIAERYRRGKLFRARAGEITTWKTAYGYRRVARSAATGPAHLEIYEPEAVVVRRIFTDRAAGTTVREICRRLNADRVPSPTGKPTWGTPPCCRLLRNEAYVGRVYYNRTESVPDRRPARRNRQVPRDRADWIPIDCPRIVTDDVFEAAGTGRRRQHQVEPTPRRTRPVAAQGPGQMRCLRGRHQLPQDAWPQRHLAPLLLLPQPRPDPRRRRRTPLPRTQHPRRRARRVRVRPDPRRAHPARPAAGRRTSRRHHHPDPRRRTARRRTRPAGPQDRRRRRREAPPGRPLPGRADRAGPSSSAAPPTSPPATANCRPNAPASPSNAPRSPAGTSFTAESTTSPNESAPSSTTSTPSRNNNSCACSSRRSASPAGTSRSGYASPSTSHRQTSHPTAPRPDTTIRPAHVKQRRFAFRWFGTGARGAAAGRRWRWPTFWA